MKAIEYYCKKCKQTFIRYDDDKICDCGSSDCVRRWGCAVTGLDSAPNRVGEVGGIREIK